MQKKNPVKKAAKKKKGEIDITSEIVQQKPEELQIREFKWTEKQTTLIDLINDRKTKIVFIKGPAGTSKSLVPVYCALKQIQEKKTDELVYIRSIVESSSKSLGSLPGDLDQKFAPFTLPLVQKLDELLPTHQVDALLENKIVQPIPNGFLRGCQFRGFTFVDEAQGLERFELTTIITRFADGGRFVIAGDPAQSDIKSKSGFSEFYDLFDNEESRAKGIFVFEFTKEDILRSKILNFICGKIETLK